jgi:hypothetical protein
VFVWDGAAWSQQAKLTASDAALGDQFGFSVALSGDTAVVGARGDNGGVGAAYVYVRQGSTWSEQTKLTAPDGAAGDEFGYAVGVEGDTALVGTPLDDTTEGTDAGSTRVVTRSGAVWTMATPVTPSGAAAGDQFGSAVGMSSGTVVIGAGSSYFSAGAAYVFVGAGASWSEQAKLTAPNPASFDKFGRAVGVSGDTIVIGVHGSDLTGTDAGVAYVFVRDSSVWTQQAELVPSDPAAAAHFGRYVVVLGDTAVIGAPGPDTSPASAGVAYVFGRDQSSWSQQERLTPTDATAGDQFGHGIALSGDRALIGADLDTTAGGTKAGSAYVLMGAPPIAACADGVDNDLDGLADSGDPGCSSSEDNDEHGTALCDDGIDNDGDGLADYKVNGTGDPGCNSPTDNREQNPQPKACNDGLDNDGDGLIDWKRNGTGDPGCTSKQDTDETG